jgi:hypothetical protein
LPRESDFVAQRRGLDMTTDRLPQSVEGRWVASECDGGLDIAVDIARVKRGRAAMAAE